MTMPRIIIAPSKPFINVRNDPRMELPYDTTIILLPTGPCASSPDKVLSYKEFSEAIT